MFTYNYRICELNIEVTSSHELPTVDKWELFAAAPAPADASISFRCCDELPEPQGEYLGCGTDYTVYRSESGLCRWVDIAGKNTAVCCWRPGTAANEIRVRSDVWDVATDFRYMWSTAALSQLLIRRNAMVLHSSYISVGGQGIVFSAVSGTGKSTQAALWEKYRGAEIINGDKSGISVRNGEAKVHGMPFAGTSGICKNRTLPLKAIVLLKQAPENSVRILRGAEAISAVLANVYLDISADEDRAAALSLVMDTVAAVPIYELSCTPDEGAVKALEFVIFK